MRFCARGGDLPRDLPRVFSGQGPTEHRNGHVERHDEDPLERLRHVLGRGITGRRRIDHFLVVDGENGEDVNGNNDHPVERGRPWTRRQFFRRVVEGLEQPARSDIEIAIRHEPVEQAIVIEPVEGDGRDQDVR